MDQDQDTEIDPRFAYKPFHLGSSIERKSFETRIKRVVLGDCQGSRRAYCQISPSLRRSMDATFLVKIVPQRQIVSRPQNTTPGCTPRQSTAPVATMERQTEPRLTKSRPVRATKAKLTPRGSWTATAFSGRMHNQREDEECFEAHVVAMKDQV